MASITIRNLDDSLKAQLRLRAASNGRSMEEEVRILLRDALNSNNRESDPGLGTRIKARFAGSGCGEELSLPGRGQPPRAPDLTS